MTTIKFFGIFAGGRDFSAPRSAASSPQLQQEIEDLKRAPPMLGRGILQIGIDDLESARQRNAQPAHDVGKLGLGLLAIGQIERWPGSQVIRDRLQLDRFVDCLEGVNALLQPLGDR
jgi:hypothetical protein